MRQRWSQLRNDVLSEKNIFCEIDSLSSIVRKVQKNNFDVWPVLGMSRSNFYSDPSVITYDDEINALKRWIHIRLEWMDLNMKANERLIAQLI